MTKPTISENFTIEDIHKVREYNYEYTKEMSSSERENYYKEKANSFKKRLKKVCSLNKIRSS